MVDFEIDESAVSGLSEARLEQQISEVIDSTNNALASSKANDPEVDTFEAIKQAARGLTGEAGDKCLYILDSGLSTEGELNVLSENLHRLIDVQPIVDKLQKDHALPDLTGVQVVWIGLGDAADKQEDLTSRNKNTLKELWEAVLTTSGAEVTFKNLPLTEEGSTDRELPEVTPKSTTAGLMSLLETKLHKRGNPFVPIQSDSTIQSNLPPNVLRNYGQYGRERHMYIYSLYSGYFL